jgi:hypothetical protein
LTMNPCNTGCGKDEGQQGHEGLHTTKLRMINTKWVGRTTNNLMPNAAFRAITHFIRGTSLGDSLMAKMAGVRELGFVQFLQDFLLLFRCFLHPFIEFISGRMPHFCFATLGRAFPTRRKMELSFPRFKGIGPGRLTPGRLG